jgi:hypothetical protein
MREFFHGWRRKTGIITLVVGLGLMGMWIRSYRLMDIVVKSNHLLGSCEGFLLWCRRPQSKLYFFTCEAFGQKIDPDVWKIPYGAIVIPLTILSAYLILWKPRKRAKQNA